ncbi:MAG: TlpA family protein disulfide reductase [Acidimicrobiia bacterium]
MVRPRRLFLLITLAIAVFASACTSSSEETPSQEGGSGVGDTEIAPIFSVPTTDGGEFSLSEHIADDGRPVFLNLWASWCFPCREEMPAIDAAAIAHPEVAFIGVAVQDSETDATEFAEEIGVSYVLGFDNDADVENTYNPLGLPASYIISGEGVIVERIFGKVTEQDLADKFAEHFG